MRPAWKNILVQTEEGSKTFFDSLQYPDRTQSCILKQILYRNSESNIGSQLGFGKIKNYVDFQKKVPITSYENLIPYINAIASGESTVLTTDEVLVFEQTGGSSAGSKYIPLTAPGLDAIRKAVVPWLSNLLTNRPGIADGKAYWSISPAFRPIDASFGKIMLGLQSDAAYFGADIAANIGQTLAVPEQVASIEDHDLWQVETLSRLILCQDLSFISVWSPTFLLELLASLPGKLNQLFRYAHYHPDIPTPASQRIAEIESAAARSTLDTSILWPNLDTISCWLDGSAEIYKKQLEDLFPDVYIQPKGLLATETVVSIPVCNENGSVLAISSGFFEFVDSGGGISLAHELEIHQTYRVLITTFSGLYRYDLGDLVKVTGFYAATPLLQFCGRSGLTSDMCGEKITEAFAISCLSNIPCGAMLLPNNDRHPGYVLFLDMDGAGQYSSDLCREVERSLSENPQYDYARKTNQLASLEYCCVKNLWRYYQSYRLSQGTSLGDIKPVSLSLDLHLLQFLLNCQNGVSINSPL